jgi:hypothetical protein
LNVLRNASKVNILVRKQQTGGLASDSQARISNWRQCGTAAEGLM